MLCRAPSAPNLFDSGVLVEGCIASVTNETSTTMSKIDSFLDGRVLKHVTLYRLIFLLVAFLIIAFIIDLASKPRYPKSLPRVGYGDNAIATLRNWIGYVIHFGQWCDEGYFQV